MSHRRTLRCLVLLTLLTAACSSDESDDDEAASGMAGSSNVAGAGGSAGVSGSVGAAGMAGSGSADPEGDDAEYICREQISCGYQLADQAFCVELFELLVPEKLETCRACIEAEECAVERQVCLSACSTQ